MFKHLFLLSFLFVTMPVHAGKGMVEITSEPLGAKIFLNGKIKGSTPQQAGKVLLLELEEGEYKLEAKINEDSLATFDLFIASGAIQPVHLVLEKHLKIGDKFVKVGETFKDCPDCPEMVVLAGGAFKMGSGNGEDNEKPVHEVKIKPFAIGKFEVTLGEFKVFVNATNYSVKEERHCNWDSGKFAENDRQPVQCVSWEDATKYAEWLSKKTAKNYRLPTEAEWEYAARANTSTKWSFGDNESDLKDYAWYDKNSDSKTHEVGQKKPNGFGLFDMHGNVWEWTCSDNENYSKNKHLECLSKNDASKSRRGGSWLFNANYCRSALRNYSSPGYRVNDIGFRVVSVFSL